MNRLSRGFRGRSLSEEDGAYKKNEVEILAADHGFYIVGGLEAGQQACLRHPFARNQLHLPDFNAPSRASRGRRFIIMN